ncbi:MAG: TIGR03545 family protein [Syntrophobacterales bacterium]|nr:MAG: TIGR03545 family protein [Syntrophobacterales bacterium]
MRWKFIIPFLVLALIIVAFALFFLNGIVESIVEERASLLNRAKVEIEDLDIGFLRPGVRIRGLAVANSDNPWRNMVEVGDIAISVSALPLFSKRIVIDEMAMENVRVNTKRKTSGELPRRLKKRVKAEGKGEKSIEFPFPKLPNLEVFKKKFDLKELVDINRLESVRRAKQLAEDASTIKSIWEQKLKDLDVKAKADEMMTKVQESVEAFRKTQIKGPADLLKLQSDLRNLRETVDALKGLRKEIEAKKSAFERDLATLQKSVKDQMSALRERDLRALLKDLGIEEFKRLRLTEAFLGPYYAKVLDLIWNNADKIRTFMPKIERDKPVQTRIRAQGRDIIFPTIKKGPSFLLREARVSMEQKKWSLRGTIRGITSDPTSYGKPTRVAIQGIRPRLTLNAMFDHTGETPIDTVSLDLRGYALDGFTFSENPLSLANITRGFLDLKTNLALKGGSIDLKTGVTVKNLVLGFTDKGTENPMVNIVKEVMKTASSLHIGIAAKGTRDNPQLSISSDIDRLFTRQLNRFAGKKLKELKASLRVQIDGATGGEMKDFSNTLAKGKLDIVHQFRSDESLVQENIDFLSRIISTKLGKSKSPQKGLEGTLQDLIGK